MRTPTDPLALRQCVLAVSVLSDIDLHPADDGVVLATAHPVLVPWHEIATAVADHPPEGPVARRRAEELLRLRALVAQAGAAREQLDDAARLVALPTAHADHPGAGWVRERLRGGALDLGIGVLGLLGDADRVVPLTDAVASAAGLDLGREWPRLRRHVERMGALAAIRLKRDGGGDAVIRPVGGCDVLGLLASRELREHLASSDGTGMRAVGIPMRRRGWFDLSRIDPAFVGAAWSATDEHDRGVPQALLVTADEVGFAADRR